MSTTEVSEAAQRRIDAAIDASIDAFIEDKLSKVKLAAPISPHAKIKLRAILKHYAKDPHPFRACVRDNMQRFGPGRVEAVCATLKDTIMGNKNWRKGGGHKLDEAPELDGDVLLALDAISEIDLQGIFMEVRALEEFGTTEAVSLVDVAASDELASWGHDGEIGLAISAKQRQTLPKEDFVFPDTREYPIDTLARARNALARGAQNETGDRLKAIVRKVKAKWPTITIDPALVKKAGS